MTDEQPEIVEEEPAWVDLINNDSERRVLVHLRYPRTVSDVRSLLKLDEAQGVRILDGNKADTMDIPAVLAELARRGLAKSFYGVNSYALANIVHEDEDTITHEPAPDDLQPELGDDRVPTGNMINYGGESPLDVWSRRSAENTAQFVFQPDAPYFYMTQLALDFLSAPGPDVPDPNAPKGPVVIGMGR